MGRIIKFRAWDGEKFVDPKYLSCYGNGAVTWVGSTITKNLIVMQYTGLKDKNGKEIYEGDIVKSSIEGPGMNYQGVKFIIYDDDEGYSTIKHCGWYAGHSLADMAGECEVIGNVHENSELLKG